MISQDILARKGATRAAQIPTEVLGLLNAGELATVNLTEWLAVDQRQLITAVFPNLGLERAVQDILDALDQIEKPSTMKQVQVVGTQLYHYAVENRQWDAIFERCATHLSDSIRCYATYLIALNEEYSLDIRLEKARFLIDDIHFGVREIVWMAFRPSLVADLSRSIAILARWSDDSSANIRRFTTESLRPKGVWTKAISSLQQQPEQALVLLEPLKSDPSLYVQNSVANWLNDASKSRPDFVEALAQSWLAQSPSKATSYIVKRALRSINK